MIFFAAYIPVQTVTNYIVMNDNNWEHQELKDTDLLYMHI